MDYFHYLDTVAGYNLFQDGNPIRREGYFTDMLTDEAIGFLERQQSDKPVLPVRAVHLSAFAVPGTGRRLPTIRCHWTRRCGTRAGAAGRLHRDDRADGRVHRRLARKRSTTGAWPTTQS